MEKLIMIDWVLIGVWALSFLFVGSFFVFILSFCSVSNKTKEREINNKMMIVSGALCFAIFCVFKYIM